MNESVLIKNLASLNSDKRNKLVTPLKLSAQFDKTDFVTKVNHTKSTTTRSKTSTSSMRGWLTKLNLHSRKSVTENLASLVGARPRFKEATPRNQKPTKLSYIEQERLLLNKFKKLAVKHSNAVSQILDKCEKEGLNDSTLVLQQNLWDLFVEDFKKENFEESLEILQKLDTAQSDTLPRLFYLMKNFIAEERQQAEGIRKEFKSGMMDPNRKAAVFERMIGSKRFEGGEGGR